jgi:MerR family transcriptional regulator, light-induced transcriptional regulator
MTWIYTISDIERDTGIAKDRLRVWERRYGFPLPQRDETQERVYDEDQLLRLRLIKRLLDVGMRAGRVVPMSLDALQREVEAVTTPVVARVAAQEDQALLAHLVSLVKATNRRALHQTLMQIIAERGLSDAIEEVIAPLGAQVGEFWLSGQMAIYQEHLFTAVVKSVLIQAMEQQPLQANGKPPRVLLATLATERHEVGLLMAESMFAQAGCERLSLGPSMPLTEIVTACLAVKPDIFAISFSSQNAPKEVLSQLRQLRGMLPAETEIWVGGSAVALRLVPDAQIAKVFGRARELRDAIEAWRNARA